MKQLPNMVFYSRFKANLLSLNASIDKSLAVKANKRLKKFNISFSILCVLIDYMKIVLKWLLGLVIPPSRTLKYEQPMTTML